MQRILDSPGQPAGIIEKPLPGYGKWSIDNVIGAPVGYSISRFLATSM